ncbi:7176_t:CDS:2, partial [Scutellospora calospora]
MDEIEYASDSGHGYDRSLTIQTESIYEYERYLGATEGIAFNINSIIGSGIFLTPGNVWRLTKSPGAALLFWIVGGLISLLGSLIYAE